jgi:hypothetical protein
MWKNFVEPEEATDDNTIWRKRFARWVTESSVTLRNTHFLGEQNWVHERASVLRQRTLPA